MYYIIDIKLNINSYKIKFDIVNTVLNVYKLTISYFKTWYRTFFTFNPKRRSRQIRRRQVGPYFGHILALPSPFLTHLRHSPFHPHA